MSTDRKDSDKKQDEIEHLKSHDAKYFFVKCHMQSMPHGENYVAAYNLIAKTNPEGLTQVIFQFDHDAKAIDRTGIKHTNVPGTGLPAVRYYPWKPEPCSDFWTINWNNFLKDLSKSDKGPLEIDCQRITTRSYDPIPEIQKHISFMHQYHRIPDLDFLKKVPDLSQQLFYSKASQSSVDKYNPKAKEEIVAFFKKLPGFFSPGLITLIAEYHSVDPAIEQYLDSIGNELNLNHFLKIELILHPECAAKVEKMPDQKDEIPRSILK